MTEKTIKQSVRFRTDEEKKLLEKVNIINQQRGINFNEYVLSLIKKDLENTNIDDVLKEIEKTLNS